MTIGASKRCEDTTLWSGMYIMGTMYKPELLFNTVFHIKGSRQGNIYIVIKKKYST